MEIKKTPGNRGFLLISKFEYLYAFDCPAIYFGWDKIGFVYFFYYSLCFIFIKLAIQYVNILYYT